MYSNPVTWLNWLIITNESLITKAQVDLDLVNYLVDTLTRVNVKQNFTFAIYYELCKVPWYAFYFTSCLIWETRGVFAQMFENSMGVFTIYVALLHDGKHYSHCVSRIVFYFFVRRRFLIHELIWWKGYNLQPKGMVLIVHVHKLLIAFVVKSSLRSNVHNYTDFKTTKKFF